MEEFEVCTRPCCFMDWHSAQRECKEGRKSGWTLAPFDLIVGTSTGAILAVALAAGVPLETVIALYRAQARAIFRDPTPPASPSLWIWALKHLRTAANGSEPFRAALAEILKTETLGELYARRRIALCIPAINVETQKSWVFKTPHGDEGERRLQRDNGYQLVDVCMASAAAPIVFPIHGVKTPENPAGDIKWFVDGGLWANNPALVGLTEALTTAPADAPIELLSVSTCPPFQAPTISARCANRGVFGWRAGMRMMETSVDAQAYAYDYLTKTLATQVNRGVTYVRLTDPKVSPDKVAHLRLDNPSDTCLQALVSLASEAVDLNVSEATTGAKLMAPVISMLSGLNTL